MFGFTRIKNKKDCSIRFFPLYKGHPENTMTHRDIKEVSQNCDFVKVKRNDGHEYLYPIKSVMTVHIYASK